MISTIATISQGSSKSSRSITLPSNFPTPKYKFGDVVTTDESDFGTVVGMTLVRHQGNIWWYYDVSLFKHSTNYFVYQNEVEGLSSVSYPETALSNA